MQDLKFYPECYYSHEVQKLLKSRPDYPQKPIVPQEPKRPATPKEVDYANTGCLVIFVLVPIILLIFAATNGKAHIIQIIFYGLLSVLAGGGLLLFEISDIKSSRAAKKTYEKFMFEHEQLMADYQEAYKAYLTEKDNYDNCVKRLSSLEYIEAFRTNLIRKWTTTRSLPTFRQCEGSDIIKTGVSEHMFAEKLKQKGYDILINQKIPAGNKFFYPDILIKCDGLYIDIEIDEPYSGADGTPIHYVDNHYRLSESIDQSRNEYISSKGFEIIRFSEEQIFLHTDDCINYIECVINSIKNASGEYSLSFAHIVKKWTKEEAANFAYRRFRNTYVPQNLQQYIAAECYRSYAEADRQHSF